MDLEYISDRINFMLDQTGDYPPVNKGRAAQVADEFGFGRTTVGGWIAPYANAMPSKSKAIHLIEGCLKKTNTDITVEEVLAWLDSHPEKCNPFLSPTSSLCVNTEVKINRHHRHI